MTYIVWLYILSRMTICVMAGELFIRYAAWAFVLYKKVPPFAATPLVQGVTLLMFARCNIEGRWLSYLLTPYGASTFSAVDANDIHSALARVLLICGLIYLWWPASGINYDNVIKDSTVEVLVKIFLAVALFACGWIAATVFYFHV